MKQNGNFNKVQFLLGIFIVFTIMALTGCSSFPSNTDTDGDFDSMGLPNHKYLVGGGLDIEWRAPKAGTAYLVEENTKKLIMTKSLDAEDEVEFSPGSFDEDEVKALFGSEMKNLKFSIYFIPTVKLDSKD